MSPSRTVFTKTHGRDFSHQNSTRLRCTAFSRFLKATANACAQRFVRGPLSRRPAPRAPLAPCAPRAPRATRATCPSPRAPRAPREVSRRAWRWRPRLRQERKRKASFRAAAGPLPPHRAASPPAGVLGYAEASCPPRPRGQAGVTGSHTWTRFHTVAVVATTASPAGEPAAGSRPRTPPARGEGRKRSRGQLRVWTTRTSQSLF